MLYKITMSKGNSLWPCVKIKWETACKSYNKYLIEIYTINIRKGEVEPNKEWEKCISDKKWGICHSVSDGKKMWPQLELCFCL